MESLFVYLENLFFITFGCKTSSAKGLFILVTLSMLNLLLAWLTLQVSRSLEKEDLTKRW